MQSSICLAQPSENIMRCFKLWTLTFTITILPVISQAQLLEVMPVYPVTDDTVVIIYNAALGNGALAGYNGDVFAHTGVITTESNSPNDWKHVVDDWGTFDSTTLMESLGNDLYRISYHIKSFYSINAGEQVLQLAFVFRNQNGSLVGRSADNSDIYYTINLKLLGDYQSHNLTGNVLTINTAANSIAIQPYSDQMFRVSLLPAGSVNPDTSFSVIMQPAYSNPVLSDFPDHLEFDAGNFKVLVSKFPLRLSFIYNNDTLLKDASGIFQSGESSGTGFQLKAGEHIYGTGSRAIDIDRNGKKLTSYNTAQYGYSNGAQTLNINIPFVISSNGYGLYFDNYSPGTWDIGSANAGVLQYIAESGALTYFVITGSNNETILDNYTDLTGKQPLPPRWALGYIQSKYGYQNETEARNIVNLMRQNDFPLDALVLDLYWFGSPSTMGNLNWDYTKWPQPVDMMHDFDSLGIKTICITEPYITQNSSNYSFTNSNGLLATNASGNSYVIGNFWAGSAGLLDMFSSGSQDWMWNYYNNRIGEGVSGWWCDLGEPENHPQEIYHSIGKARTVHNVYSLIWAEFLAEKYAQFHPDQRLFNLIRSGYAGMQRYSTFPWSGDIQRSFSGLQAQIPIMLGDAMSGIGYMHSDLGGFTGGGQNEELYVRWLEFGSFCPIMRAHGEGVPTEPVYYSTNAKNIIRKFSKLRHQLTPYNYSLAYENSVKGLPLARPLDFYEPQNEQLANINDEYLWGENFLVAPVMNEGQTSRSVTLPSGTWINFWNNQAFTGNATITASAALDAMPLYVKAGSFIPMVPSLNSLATYNTDTLIVKYYADNTAPNSSFSLYDDDGKDPQALANSQFQLIRFDGTVSTNEVKVSLSKTGDGFTGVPAKRALYFQVQRILSAPSTVLWKNVPMPIVNTFADYNATDSAAYYDAASAILHVHFKWFGENGLLLIQNAVVASVTALPVSDFTLLDPFPNPGSGLFNIPFVVANSSGCSLSIYNLSGSLIRHFDLQNYSSGPHQIIWDGKSSTGNVADEGVYLLVMSNGQEKVWKKLVVIKAQ